jgi:hypothetical protein
MKCNFCLSLVVSIATSIPSGLTVHAQGIASPAKTASGTSLLSASQQRSLKSLGIKIAVPRYVPMGFRVVAVTTEPCRPGSTVDANGVCRFGPEYTVVYGNARNNCFVVSGTGGGIGGPGGRFTRAVNTKLLGRVDVNVGTGNAAPMTAAIANTPQENVWTFPAGTSPFYSVGTMVDNRARSLTTCSQGAYMTPNELIKIVQSLEWLP